MRENIDSAKNTEQLQILLSRFSHELRNPLALLSSELQLLASSHPDLSYDEQWENILGNLEYIHALLDDLSRYQNAGHLSLVLTDLSTCLNEIASSFRPVLEYLEIEFETDIPHDLPKLYLDPLNPTGISEHSSKCPGINQPSAWNHPFSCRIHHTICPYLSL